MGGPLATAEAVDEMARFVHGLSWSRIPTTVADRLRLVLFDEIGAALVGAPMQTREREAWLTTPGTAALWGTGRFVDLFSAAFLNAQAMVCLELDEGNKYAEGHPAAHGFPAVLALASALDTPGPRTAAALLACYEVSARFGRATRLRPGAHPHGSWGVAGAAAGCAKLLDLDAPRTAAAIDTGSGLPVAGHFASALDGNPVRDAWIGVANTSGLVAAQLAASAAARNTGTAAHSLGELLGDFEPDELTAGLHDRFEIEHNYFKRHPSCSYTHPVADLVPRSRAELFGVETTTDVIAREVESVRVDTHALAVGLNRTSWHNALSAMFSIPFVAAAALAEGEVSPRSMLPPAEVPDIAALAQKVHVVEDPELTALLPRQRAARVTVRTRDGRVARLWAPNPVGDSDHHPLDHADLRAMFTTLLGTPATELNTIEHVAWQLPLAPRVQPLLRMLADPVEHGRFLV